MKRDSELAPSIPLSAQRASVTLTMMGNIGFWVQIVVGSFAVVTFLFASTGLLSTQDKTRGIEVGIFSALAALVCLGIGIYFSVRYRQLGRKLQTADASSRPKKADIISLIRFGLGVNLVGMALAIIGGAAISGIVLVKSLSIPQGTLAANPKQFVQSIDLLAIQANVNTIIAHFTGLLSSLWLLDRINR